MVPTTKSLLTALGYVALFTALTSCSSDTSGKSSAANSVPRKGGVIRIATIGDPETLDQMTTTAGVTQDITINMFEGLFTIDSHLKVQPSLAKGYQIHDHGLRWIINLRQGVLFHNGQELTSDDVLASLQRWGKIADTRHLLFDNVVALSAVDRYALEIRLKAPSPILPALLAVRPDNAVIHPKSVIDAAGTGPLQEFIGTGPYQFASWLPGRYIELRRFDRYQSRTEAADGMAGQREAYADAIRFIPVPEAQRRIQGVQTGLYDVGNSIPADLYAEIQNMPSLEAMIAKSANRPAFVFNKREGIFRDLKMRQAILAAADVEPMLQAAYGSPSFYEVEPSVFSKETGWATDAGKEFYNQKDREKAKRLLKDAGYQGQVIRILTTRQYDYQYKVAEVLKSQLEAAGLRVLLDVVDWATLLQRRRDPRAYDMFTTGFTMFTDPITQPFWSKNWPGWWEDARKESLLEQFSREPDHSERLKLAAQLQQRVYEDSAILNIGNAAVLRIKSRKAVGDGLGSSLQYFFNCWVAK